VRRGAARWAAWMRAGRADGARSLSCRHPAMLAFVRVSCVVWAIGVWGWLRDVCLMCNGPDRSNPPSTSARGGPGGRARGGNGCEGGDGCLRAVLQSMPAALAGLLALLSLPNMFFSRFTTCLRAAAMLAMFSKPHPLLPRGRGRQSQCSCASRPALPWRHWA
jgi:hypothetical protein